MKVLSDGDLFSLAADYADDLRRFIRESLSAENADGDFF